MQSFISLSFVLLNNHPIIILSHKPCRETQSEMCTGLQSELVNYVKISRKKTIQSVVYGKKSSCIGLKLVSGEKPSDWLPGEVS